MKKTILTIAAVLMASASSFGQGFVQAPGNTGFTYDCENKAGADFAWGYYGPGCAGAPDNGGGGTEEGNTNELVFNWGQGNNGSLWVILTLTTPLDLSNSANRKVHVKLKNLNGATNAAMPITYTLRLENDGNTTPILTPITLTVTGTYQTFDLDLNSSVVSGQDLSNVKKIIFHYDGCPSGTIYAPGSGNPAALYVSDYKVGSPLVTGLNNSSSVADANLFPNPSTGTTTVSGELKSVSDVKITLVDMLGQEVKVIAEERTSTINSTFDVSNLKKGIYTVVTNIDGAPAKSQMLVVK